MILSDRSILDEIKAGRIVIEPLDLGNVQPSSVDLHVDRYFRVFRNDTTPYIDPKVPQEDLTEIVEVFDGRAFILHPGEFVLGSTRERIALADDLVARLEGKSSLGRLGLLIHSSLPESEPVYVLEGSRLSAVPIGDVVRKRMRAHVVAFDPKSLEVGFHRITGWYEGPPDRIFEVKLSSGRVVRVTGGHNFFSLDRDGELRKVRTGELATGSRIAIPRRVPDPPEPRAVIDVLALAPEGSYDWLTIQGRSVAALFERTGAEIRAALRAAGYRHVDYYRARSRLPLRVALQFPGLLDMLGSADRICVRGSTHGLPPRLDVEEGLAWLLGLYVAEGSRRAQQFAIANTAPQILDRAERILRDLGFGVYRTPRNITCCSKIFSVLIGWLGTGDGAPRKRIPPLVFGWPRALRQAFLDGLVDGDGTREPARTSVWTCSPGLVADMLFLAPRLELRASASYRDRSVHGLYQVQMPVREHKLLTAVPLPDRLLIELRRACGLSQVEASRRAGYWHASDLNDIELRCGRDAVRLATLRRLRDAYAPRNPPRLHALERLIDGGIAWDTVAEVRDTGVAEPIFDLEVRPQGRRIENFLAGDGGVFVSNTAGFVDAGWDGHLTLELSNVANLPIAIYPGMKIGQISFLRMSTAADHPYGSQGTGSKYQGQRGPTPSRYYLNFERDE